MTIIKSDRAPRGRGRCAVLLPIRKVLFGDEPERGARCGLGGDTVVLALHGRVRAAFEKPVRLRAFSTCVGDRNRGEGTEAEHLLDAGAPVAKTPEFTAVWLDLEIEAVAIGMAVGAFPWETLFLRRRG